MAETCGDGCAVICDFCTYYSDNGLRKGEAFDGEGICTLTNEETDACGGCDDYVCFRIKNEEVAKGDDGN